MDNTPTFSDFYRAVHDRDPLPWQAALADHVIKIGWPSELGVPTGLGKTAAIDIAVWSLAAEAHLEPHSRKLPTRIWYVVNRRILVNDAKRHADRLAGLLEDALVGSANIAGVDVLRVVAERLLSRQASGPSSRPLFVTELRGGLDRREMPPDPVVPSVICSTVPMFGSRLLFRGYGGGSAVRPIQTALAAVDSLVLLDEAHLSQPLQRLMGQLAEADRGELPLFPESNRAEPKLVAVTATGGTSDRFELTEDDLTHPLVRQRLDAPKPTRLLEVPKNRLEQTLAEQVVNEIDARSSHTAAVIFANSPRIVSKIVDLVHSGAKRIGRAPTIAVLTGQLRGADAGKVRESLEPLRTGRDRSSLENDFVVIATQTLEVGADLDFDVLVTPTAGIRAVTQRFGRLNRIGDPECQASAVVVHTTGPPDSALYGDEPQLVWDRLVAAGSDLDLGPGRISSVLGVSDDVGPRSPELLPNHLDEWAKTTIRIVGEAPVELFFEGIGDRRAPRCTVVWRAAAVVSEAVSRRPGSGHDAVDRLLPPLRSDETVEIPLPALTEFLGERAQESVYRLGIDGVNLELVRTVDIRPGDTVIVFDDLGGYRSDGLAFGWDPQSTTRVGDLTIPDPGQGEFAQGVWLDSVSVHRLVDRLAESMTPEDVAEWLGAVSALVDSDAVMEDPDLLDDLASAIWRYANSHDAMPDRFVERLQRFPRGWWVTPADRFELSMGADADALDELSLAPRPFGLWQHLNDVGSLAGQTARLVGLTTEIVDSVISAGRLHDLGKLEPRFQKMLGAGRPTIEGPLAKSGSPRHRWRSDRIRSGWPSGGRHEAISVRIASEPAIAEALEDAGLLDGDRELILHLVASHHGHGRSGQLGVQDATGASFDVDLEGFGVRGAIAAVDGDLSGVDWDQPARFAALNRRYGRRGLALIEAVLRQADWVASGWIDSETSRAPKEEK